MLADLDRHACSGIERGLSNGAPSGHRPYSEKISPAVACARAGDIFSDRVFCWGFYGPAGRWTPKNAKIRGMKNPDTPNPRIAKMTFASVYPMYLAKVVKKGRTREELHQVITWLTSFDDTKLQKLMEENVTFEAFFQRAALNPKAGLITGVICGYRVEEIQDPLTQKVRYLDKLVDELAQGRKMEKILRGP